MVCCYFRIVYTVEPEHMLGLFLLEHIGIPLQTCSWQFIYTYSGKKCTKDSKCSWFIHFSGENRLGRIMLM